MNMFSDWDICNYISMKDFKFLSGFLRYLMFIGRECVISLFCLWYRYMVLYVSQLW